MNLPSFHDSREGFGSQFEFLENSHNILTCILVVFFAFVYRFSMFPEFFLYEDDWYFYSTYYNSCPNAISTALGQFTEFLQGRPFFFSFTVALSCSSGGKLWVSYLIGAVIFSVNMLLLFLILRRYFHGMTAVLAVLLYIIQPWDTTQAYFTHIMSAQLALTFALLGFVLLISRYFILYAVATLFSLFCYEGAFFAIPGFILIAFIRSGSVRERVELGLCLGAWLGVLVFYSLLRIFLAESRVSISLSGGNFIRSLFSRWADLVLNMYNIIYYSISEVLNTIYPSVFTFSLTFCLTFTMFLCLIYFNRRTAVLPPRRMRVGGVLPRWAELIIFFFLGLAVLFPFVLSADIYPSLAGRGGRYYVASAIWFCLFLAIFLSVRTSDASSLKVVKFGTLVALLYIFGAYAFLVQRQYVEIGAFQLRIYNEVFSKVDDLKDDRDILLIVDDYLKDYGRLAMNRHTWMLDRMPNALFSVGGVRVLSIDEQRPETKLTLDGEIVRAKPDVHFASLSSSADLRAGKIIVLKIHGDKVERLDSLIVDGREVAAPMPSTGVGRAAEVLPLTRFGRWFFKRAARYKQSYPR